MTDDLIKLAERVEALAGPDREVDWKIYDALGKPTVRLKRAAVAGWDDATWAPFYTTSLDAAMTLYIHKPDMISSCPRKVVVDALQQRSAFLGQGPEGEGK